MQIIHLHYTYARAVVVTEPVLARAENRGSQTLTDNSTHNQGVQSMNDKTEIQHKITHLAQPTINHIQARHRLFKAEAASHRHQ